MNPAIVIRTPVAAAVAGVLAFQQADVYRVVVTV